MTQPRNSDELAEALREDTASESDMARMERGLVDAVRARRVAAPSGAPRFSVVALGFAVAAAVVFWLRPGPAPREIATHETGTHAPVASTVVGPAVPDLPELHTGSLLAAGSATLANATLRLEDGAVLTVVDDAIAHAEVHLAIGVVHVAFHPVHRGAEHLAIVTETARVEVVGTELVVTRRSDGATHVAVSEGVVRVIETGSGEAHEVRAGGEIEIGSASATTAVSATSTTSTTSATSATSATTATRGTGATVEDAQAAVDADDAVALARIAEHGDPVARVLALEGLADIHRRAGDSAAAIADCTRLIALDPHGDDGASALFDRAVLRENAGDPAAQDDFALYVERFPDGPFVRQAEQRLAH